MAYTLYRNVRVLSIGQEEVVRRTRPQEIADPTRRRDNYHVTVARFSDVDYEVTIADFKGHLQQGHEVSIAVNDKWQLIAIVNHTTGKQHSIQAKRMPFSEYFSILFFIAIPGVLCYAIARKAFQTVKYHDMGWVILGIGLLIIFLILRGINKEFKESKDALGKLKN